MGSIDNVDSTALWNFMLYEQGYAAEVIVLFKQVIDSHKIVVDKSRDEHAGIENIIAYCSGRAD
jgi:hypothetical protein